MSIDNKLYLNKYYAEILNVIDDCTDDYIFIYNITRDYFEASEDIMKKYDLPKSSFYNATTELNKITHNEDCGLFGKAISAIVNETSSFIDYECRWIDNTGKITWVNIKGELINSSSEEKIIVGRINRLGLNRKADDMTGFRTEAYLKANFEHILNSFTSEKKSLMVIGVDNLKVINQKNGLAGGNRAIEYFANAIKVCIPSSDNVFRMTGAEFIICMDMDEESAKKQYDLIRNKLDEIIHENDYDLFFTISAGIVAVDSYEYDDIKVRLEFALFQAKNKGRNCAIIYDSDSYKEYVKMLDIKELLRHSINNDFEGYEVYYQPIVDSKTSRLIGAEALLRWHCEKYGNLSPVQFIPILEESGLIIPVGKWVAYTAIKQCKEWQKIIPDFKININLSYIQIKKSNVANDILQLIEKIDIDPQYLTFEFTESGYIENDSTVQKLINVFKAEGIKLALDDFGTGYSNLAYLKDLHVNTIKIDRSFVNMAMEDENIYRVINYIIQMAHNIELSVCIEGIENETERERICQLFPDCIQGYLYGKPVPAMQFEADNMKAYM